MPALAATSRKVSRRRLRARVRRSSMRQPLAISAVHSSCFPGAVSAIIERKFMKSWFLEKNSVK
jgi:hypothetical protein